MFFFSPKSHLFSTVCVWVIMGSALSACTQDIPFKHVDKLIENRQYSSAFHLLDSLDPQNKNLKAVEYKMNLALHYHSNTIMHEMFEFHDLSKDQNLADMRRESGDFKMKEWSMHDVFQELIDQNPDAPQIHVWAAQFYYTILQHYPNGWKIKSDSLFQLMKHHAQSAINQKEGDALCHFVMGYYYAAEESYNKAMQEYAIALYKDPNMAIAHYNLALTRINMNDLLSALPSTRAAFEHYTDSSDKADAARLSGYICEKLSDDKTALGYFLTAWQHDPGNIENIHALTEIHVRLQTPDYLKYTEHYFLLDPSNEEVYKGLVEIYSQYNLSKELIDFFKSHTTQHGQNHTTLAPLNYFIAGMIYMHQPEEAVGYLKAAKTHYAKFLDKNHDTFRFIDQKIQDLSR